MILFNEKKFRECLPAEMLSEKRFVRYFLQARPGGGFAKIPLASHADPETWSSFDDAVAALEPGKEQGIGYCFLGGEIQALDIDHCRNPKTGKLCNEAMLLLSRIPSWAEYSVSGAGIHLLFKGEVRGKQLTETCIQFWNSKNSPRFFALTCDMVGAAFTTLKDIGEEFNYIFATARHVSAKIREELQAIDPEQWAALPVEPAPNKKVSETRSAGRPKKARPLHKDFKIEDFLNHYGLEIANIAKKDIGVCYRLMSCPIKGAPHVGQNSTTTNFILLKGGGLGFQCESTGCVESTCTDALAALTKTKGEYPHPIYKERGQLTPGAILINHELTRYVIEAEKVLIEKEELQYYSRSNDLVKPILTRDADQVKGLDRDKWAVIIQSADVLSLQRDLSAHATFMAYSTAKDSFSLAAPTESLARHLINRVEKNLTNYRRLNAVTQAPCLLPSGSVLQKPGYEESVLFMLRHDHFPEIPTEPTKEQATAGLKKFDPIFHKFCYVRDAGEAWDKTTSHAASLAAVLSLIGRTALPTIPLFGVTAVTRGSGKTKLVEAICQSVIGGHPTRVAWRDEDELEKLLAPLLRGADRASLIDNISRPLKSDCLCLALTAREYAARILGKSERQRVLNNTVFFATGNNLAIEGDLARRSLLIRLDPGVEQPETLHFDFDPVARAREMYAELVSAALTALRAYIVAGKPWGLSRAKLGSFEEWDALICGCLHWLGYADPVATAKHVAHYDPERAAGLELLRTWHSDYGEVPIPLSKIRKDKSETYELLKSRGDEWNPEIIAFRLRRLEGRIIAGYKLHRSERTSESRLYLMVVRLDGKETKFDDDNEVQQ
jgi:putative DNA primase/helicase